MSVGTINSGDLRGVIDVMLSIIRNAKFPEETAKMAAFVIVADARFNTLVGKMKGDKESGARILELVDFAEEIVMACRELGTDAANGLENESVHERLCDIRTRLNEFRF